MVWCLCLCTGTEDAQCSLCSSDYSYWDCCHKLTSEVQYWCDCVRCDGSVLVPPLLTCLRTWSPLSTLSNSEKDWEYSMVHVHVCLTEWLSAMLCCDQMSECVSEWVMSVCMSECVSEWVGIWECVWVSECVCVSDWSVCTLTLSGCPQTEQVVHWWQTKSLASPSLTPAQNQW